MATINNPSPGKKELPLGKSTFSKLVEGNCIYVDKTMYIHPLVRKGGAYFLSRPRRFGKSLTVSVLKEILQGNRELFNRRYLCLIVPQPGSRACVIKKFNGNGYPGRNRY